MQISEGCVVFVKLSCLWNAFGKRVQLYEDSAALQRITVFGMKRGKK